MEQDAAACHALGQRLERRASDRIEHHARTLTIGYLHHPRYQILFPGRDDMMCTGIDQGVALGAATRRRDHRRADHPRNLEGSKSDAAGRSRDDDEIALAEERGRRSMRAVMQAVAEMYVKGVSTREAEAVMREFGIESLSSSQVSRAAKLLDDELAAWRNRPLGEIKYLILDARYEKMRHGGIVRDAAVLSAIGIGPDESRRVLGVSVALSEAEVHWRAFLESLQARGLRGVQYIVSDDHAGLRAARRAVFGGATWQRCQFHLAQNAIHHAPNLAVRKRIGAELREIWNAASLAKAETSLDELATEYRDTAPKLAAWLEENVPEGLTVFTLPKHHRRRMRTSNPMERSVQQELKRRTVKVRVFPNEAALERLVSAVLVEIDDKWAAEPKAYVKWECQDA